MKIDQQGWLWLRRKGKWFQQFCPFSPVENPCGGWCPHFGEVKTYITCPGGVLQICHGKLLQSSNFIDEREEGND